MKALLSGNEALAWGAYEGGVKVASSYPGTPSTEILETLAKFDEVYAEWAPNEKVAFEVALGAAVGGARALVSMKHVGLNVAADPLMTSTLTGINAGLVIVTADDPGMHSSQNEQDNRYYARMAQIPMLEPSDPQEAHDFVKRAFEISEKFDTPVMIRMTTRISHSKAVVVRGERIERELKPYRKDIKKYVMIPGHARGRHAIVKERFKKLQEFSEECRYHTIELKDRTLGVITSGISYNYAKEVFKDASILKLGMWPYPKNLIRSFIEKVERVIVIEELEPFIEEELIKMGFEVEGKPYSFRVGELTPRRVREAFGMELPDIPPKMENLFLRPPTLCPGCPHIGVFYTLKKMRLTVTGDIGCYTLGALPPLNAMDTTVEMGASIGMAHGLEKARGGEFTKKLVAVIGESTFLHSGITGLMNMVYNKSSGTVIVLDNRTTAMTGHQDNPATGKTAKGEKTKEVEIDKLARALGVEHVITFDPHNLKETRIAIQRAIESDKLSLLISKRPCALLPEERKRWSKAKKMVVNREKCKGDACRNCLELGCPAITWIDGKSYIEPLLCTGCGLCIQVCPYKAIS